MEKREHIKGSWMESVSVFINELRNYTSYISLSNKLGEKIDELWYEMSGVKGVRYDKQRGNFNPSSAFSKYDIFSKRLEVASKQKEEVDNRIADINDVLSKITDKNMKEAIIDVYCNNLTLRNVSKRYYCSYVTLSTWMKKALAEAIEESGRFYGA